MSETTHALDTVRDYYCSPRSDSAGHRTILDIWEAGGAFNDSITPSTFVPEYRSHLVLKLLSLTLPGERVVSLGCGNAFVEAELAEQSRSVMAVDYLEEAVQLARSKGLDAFAADFFEMDPRDVADAALIYADGLVGHLLDHPGGMMSIVDKLRALELRPGMRLVISNDAPPEPDEAIAAHPRVPGFWYVSRGHLRASLAAAGWDVREDYYFPYLRPISGLRNRSICVAQVPSVGLSKAG